MLIALLITGTIATVIVGLTLHSAAQDLADDY